ncbi:MAG TPA: ABC transporter substrate-binding protein, partial [Euzebyales bacterium]|nr:ABC transporter substrate-binding protein [Euzebyales bacterium]
MSRGTVYLIALVVVCLTGCGASDVDVAQAMQVPPPSVAVDPAGPITVASFDFTESRIVAEIYAQALEAAGYPVERSPGVAAREVLEPALEQGLVDLIPEYAGTALAFLTDDPLAASADPAVTHARLVEAYAHRGVAVLDAAEAQNQNALAVRRETADRRRLSSVSDLRPIAPDLVLGGPPECPTRPLCLLGFERVYELRFERFVPLDVGGPLTVAALDSGEVDVAVLFTSDRARSGDDVVYLTDDRGLQPAEHITPVIRRDVNAAHGPGL